jgi:tRNA A-37 threonylcarbamoyl transferase component Bud32
LATTHTHFRLLARADQQAFLELPWGLPLEQWPAELHIEARRGIGRHVVRFVHLNSSFYALKELPPPLAPREYRLLGELAQRAVPAVEAIGVTSQRTSVAGEELPDILITRYLDYSLPYRLILGAAVLPAPAASIRAALGELFVRLHLAGFFWGDCSLSNALFRRDAGALSAYLVDAETGQLEERLSDGQRNHDLSIAEENLVGELYDLAAELDREVVEDPVAFAEDVRSSYEQLWAELTEDEVFAPEDTGKLEQRLQRLNALGFDVEEVELVSDGTEVRLRLHSKVVEPGHHRRRLLRLTGLDAQENQARRLLNDLTAYRAKLNSSTSTPISDTAAAGRWLSEVFEPTIAAVPADLQPKRAAAELFHELLEHRWFLSEQAGHDVGMEAATASYVADVLRRAADEQTPLLVPDTDLD